jgi:hypothetical protein
LVHPGGNESEKPAAPFTRRLQPSGAAAGGSALSGGVEVSRDEDDPPQPARAAASMR